MADAAAVAEIVEAEAAVENPDPEADQSETDRQAQEDRNALKNATNEIEDEGLRRLHADPPFIDLQDEYDTIEDVIERERRAAEEARLRGEDFQPASMGFADRFLAEHQSRADELRVDMESREAEKGKPDPAPHPYDGIFSDEEEVWFAEDATTVAAALTAEGVTTDGVWSNLTDQVRSDEGKVVVDADDATPVAYRPNAALTTSAASVTLTNLTFDAARTELPELAADVQAAVTITTNGGGACVFAIANNGKWELTATNANPEAVYTVRVDFDYGLFNTVTYSVSNETEWVTLMSRAVNPQTAKVSTVEFAGSGSFTAFDGFRAVAPPAKGSKDDPWVIGATTNDDVRAYTNGTTLVIEGSGAMRSWVLDTAPWSGLAGSIASVSIEEGVTHVSDLAFRNFTGLGEIEIPASVTNIGWSAFMSCTSLSNVTFAADSQLAEIGGFAFCQADVSEIAIPASVTSIGDFAFAICTSLVNVAFGVDSRLKSIGESAFFSCPSVVWLEVPAGVVNCGAGAFVDTPNVTVNPGNGTFAIVNGLFCDIQSMKVVSGLAADDVTIPESMEIGGFAFDGSRDLCFVKIPASVTNIGESAFLECRQLTDVLVLAIKPPALGANAFDYCGEDVGEGFEIHVPACMGATYKAAAGWSAYADKIVELSFVPVSLDDVLFCNAAEVATNVAKAAAFVPSAEVAAKLGTGTTAISNYCASFSFAIIGVADDRWAVMAALRPKAWTNVVKSAQTATRQIPLADIAALPTEGKKDVTVTGCVPGFYYTLYGAAGVRALPEGTKYGPELCGAEGEVTFPEVEKPSDAAGFFTIDVRETPGVQPSDVSHAPVTILK